MRRLLAAGAPVMVSLYITAGNMTAFRLSVMRPLSLAALLLMGGILYAKGRREGLTALDKGFFAYIAVANALFWFFPYSISGIVADFPTGILFAVLFSAVAFPALAGRYFTEYFAKKTSPEAVWQTDIFKTINRRMTWAWAVIFALSAFVTTMPLLFDLPGNPGTGFLFQVVLPALFMLGVGVPMNRRYPAYYQSKMGIEPPGPEPVGCDTNKGAHLSEAPPKENRMENGMENQRKVVAINGSPHEGVGNTSQMLGMIASVLAGEGVAMEEIYLAGKKIDYCIGCGACLEKGKCWRPDEYAAIAEKLFSADGIIFASPVYFNHVTAQMKTFIDRSLAFGHKPRTSWKPGLAVSVSAGRSETATAQYLAGTLHVFGAFAVGTLTAMATGPGTFMGKDLVEARARDLALDLVRAIKEKRQYPATDENLSFYLFMRDLVVREKEFMRDDYRHWQDAGLLKGFEAYMGQKYAAPNFDPEFRKEWLKENIRESKSAERVITLSPEPSRGPSSVISCREFLMLMPGGLRKDEAGDLSAIYQFEITGSEEFVAHLAIKDGACLFHEGPHPHPDVTIKAPADLWLAISQGNEDGQKAFMAGKYKIEGSVALLMKLGRLFRG
ncbi:MAG TPA: NAD(P)H-dependent oxidoreductase [Syntrophorhabdaceae bacterium]|jgi:multimeric flavodoxin WrbA